MEITAVDAALAAASDYDEVIVLGINYNDGLIRLHTSMEYQPDIYMTLGLAMSLMLQQGGHLND